MDDFAGDDLRLLRLAVPRYRNLRQADVARAMVPPVSRQRVAQLERRARLSPEQFRRVAAAILAAAR